MTNFIRPDDYIFKEFITNSSISNDSANEDNIHTQISTSAKEFLKKKFGTIARFYSGMTVSDKSDVNGFSRISNLRKALSALDRGGWERSYHQKIFHVSLKIYICIVFVHCIILF